MSVIGTYEMHIRPRGSLEPTVPLTITLTKPIQTADSEWRATVLMQCPFFSQELPLKG